MRRVACTEPENDEQIFKNYDEAIAEYREKVRALFENPEGDRKRRSVVRN